MLATREKPTWPENFWSSISRDTATRRLFPDLRAADVDFSTMLPGRNWEAWTLPKERTEFDIKVGALINSNKYVLHFNRERLASLGILCPYYAWRIFAVLSVENSKQCCENLSNKKIEELSQEIKAWEERRRASNYLVKNFTHIDDVSGSVYLANSDFDNSSTAELLLERRQLLLEAHQDILKCSSIIEKLQNHIKRIAEIRMTPVGRATVDLWQMSFFNKMAALFESQISKEIDTSGSLFRDIISEATYCLSDGKYKIDSWGVYKRSEDKMKLLEKNEGISIGKSGFFSMEEENTFAARGPEMLNFINICKDQNLSISDNTIINSVLDMRDHIGGDLAFLVRDVILRRLIADMGVIDSRTFIQLGWRNKIDRRDIDAAILRCAEQSRKKEPNVAAIVVLESLYTFDDYSYNFINSIKHNNRIQRFCGLESEKIFRLFDKLSSDYKTYPEEPGDFRAFRVALELLDKCCARSE